MSDIEGYIEKKAAQKQDEIYASEMGKSLYDVEEKTVPASLDQFKEKYNEQFSNKDTLMDRTEYYFKDSQLLEAKAQHYTNIAAGERELKAYAANYTNHNASKRKGYAESASKKFAEAARLERKHQQSVEASRQAEKKDFALFQHREEVIRLRLSAMQYAAKLKSRSDEDEEYRKLKAHYKCLRTLIEQLNDISAQPQTDKDYRKFAQARGRLTRELQGVENKLAQTIPVAIKKQANMHNEEKRKNMHTAGTLNVNIRDISIKKFERMKNAMNGRSVGTDKKTFHDLSQFLTGDAQKDRKFLDNYLGTGRETHIDAAMNFMADKLFSISLKGIDFTSDEKMVKSTGKLEEIFGCTAAFERFLNKNPQYMESLPQERRDKLTQKLTELRNVSSYYVSRKEVMNDTLYTYGKPWTKEYEITAASNEDERAYAEKLIKSHILSKNLLNIGGGMILPLNRELKIASAQSKEYYEKTLKAESAEEQRVYLEKAYSSMDYLVGGHILDPNRFVYQKGERYKLHKFIGHSPKRIEDDPEMVKEGQKNFLEQKKKLEASKEFGKRADHEIIVNTIKEKFGSLMYDDTENSGLGIKLKGMGMNRVIGNLTANSTANMTTDEVIEMISDLLAPKQAEKDGVAPGSDQQKEIDAKFLKAAKKYKGIILDNMRSFVGTMGNLMTQLRPEDLHSIFGNCGDILRECLMYVQDAGILRNCDKDKQLLNPDENEEDKEFIFLHNYMTHVVMANQTGQMFAIQNVMGDHNKDGHELPDYSNSVLMNLNMEANGKGKEFFKEDIEHSKYITGPSLSTSFQRIYKKSLKKNLDEIKFEEYQDMRALFEKEAVKEEKKPVLDVINTSAPKLLVPVSPYEVQGYNNCFACSGTALLNQFIFNQEGKLDKPYGQLDLRDYKIPGFKKLEDVRSEAITEEVYNEHLNEITNTVGANATAFGNMFELADFFITKRSDVAVNKMVFSLPQYKAGMSDKEKNDADALKNTMKEKFLNKVKEVIDTGNFVSVLHGNHYVTIIGVDGTDFQVLDSYLLPNEQRDVTKPVKRSLGSVLMPDNKLITEISWLSKIEDPAKLADEFDTLKYSEEEGFTSTLKYNTDANLQLAQTKGVCVSKGDASPLVGDKIITSIYVPKKSTVDEVKNGNVEQPRYGKLSVEQVNEIRKNGGLKNKKVEKKVEENKEKEEIKQPALSKLLSTTALPSGFLEQGFEGLLNMTRTKIAQRQQGFLNNSLLSDKTDDKEKTADYQGELAEIHSRRNKKSHRYDFRRKSKMATSVEKIDAVYKRLKAFNESENYQVADEIRLLEEIIDEMRISDRYFAEAISLSDEEEKALKNQTEYASITSKVRFYEEVLFNDVVKIDEALRRELKGKYQQALAKQERLKALIPKEQEKTKTQEKKDTKQQDEKKDGPDINAFAAEKRIVRENRIDKVENGAMEKLKALCKDSLDKEAAADFEKLEQLFSEFVTEAKKQITEKEKQEKVKAIPDKELEFSDYYEASEEYAKQKKKINLIYEKLENAQKDFILKYSGENGQENYKKWKEELDSERTSSRNEEQKLYEDSASDLEKAVRAVEDYDADCAAEGFTLEDYAKIEKYCKDNGIKYVQGNIERVLMPFIRPVKRDFLGVPLTEKDRKNADFNKRFKKAALEYDSEKLKELSIEFTNDFVVNLPEITPQEYEKMGTKEDIKELYEKAAKTEILHANKVKLCTLSNIHGSNNDMFPELQEGLKNLEQTDQKKYDKTIIKLSYLDSSLIENILSANQYNVKLHQKLKKSGTQGMKTTIPVLIKMYSDKYTEVHKVL